ncbi:MAG: mannonate dehydratase [Lachnospirales bacterium]
MKLGLGLYKHMLNEEHFCFAKQIGCTHIVAHLVDYYKEDEIVKATDKDSNYGVAIANDPAWEYENLLKLKNEIESHGLVFEAIENFSPADWYDVLLGGSKRDEQIENIKKIIENVGKVGIKTIGYNFSITGVWGHSRLKCARGGAVSACLREENAYSTVPLKKGEIWNMKYEDHNEILPFISKEEQWERLEYFLQRVLPVAEKYNVNLALHPDDPPMEVLRGQARLINQPKYYEKAFGIVESPRNTSEFCMGSIQVMTEGNIYDAIEIHCKNNKIAYVHFMNVKGIVP